MLFDTNFLIYYSGQRGTKEKANAQVFLDGLPSGQNLYTSRVCWMEFAAGCDNIADMAVIDRMFAVLDMDAHLAWSASRIAKTLQWQGKFIGYHDIWIAATALDFDLTLVSRNTKHFSRVEGIKLQTY
jgi:predicted nucleic acid-binding protein